MPFVRELVILALALAATLSTCLPVQTVWQGHDYGHPCSPRFRFAEAGLFVPSLAVALIVVARLRRAATRKRDSALPAATIVAPPWRSRLRAAVANADVLLRLEPVYRRRERVAAIFTFVVGVGYLFVGGPGQLVGLAAHFLLGMFVCVWRSA